MAYKKEAVQYFTVNVAVMPGIWVCGDYHRSSGTQKLSEEKKESWITDSLKNISLKELYAHLTGRTLAYNKTEVTNSAHP